MPDCYARYQLVKELIILFNGKYLATWAATQGAE